MKKFIAAILSVLVGTFGYTIVDSKIEDRVSSLESEVIELREEISVYHGMDSPSSTRIPTTNYPTNTEQTTGIYPEQGDFLGEKSDSQNKFLFRKYNDGTIRYVSVDEMNRPTITEDSSLYEEYFLYVTESSAHVLRVEEETSYNSWYDEDYSSHTNVSKKKKVTVSVDIEGYTDSVFAGKKIRFSHYSHPSISSIIYSDSLIRLDGSFSYHAEYVVYTAEGMYGQNAFYSPTLY